MQSSAMKAAFKLPSAAVTTQHPDRKLLVNKV